MRRIAAVLCASVLFGCGKPVPPEHSDYVGEWRAASMMLLITPDGSVKYRRAKGAMKTSIDAPIKEFAGDNLIVGVGPFKTTFVVTSAPHRDGDAWKMTVDGVELTRQSATYRVKGW